MNPQGVLSLAVLLGAATLLPALVLAATSFVKVSVVLGSLRNALGAPQIPGNLAVLGLSAILTLHVMAPTGEAVLAAAGPSITAAATADPLTPQGAAAWTRAWALSRPPVVRFLRVNARPEDRAFFVDLARRSRARQPTVGAAAEVREDDVAVLLPAFVVSELTRAFMIAFLLLLPFLVVDLVVANVLASAGLHGVTPTSVALPFKLLLFVGADGWHHLARSLVLAYR